MGLKLSHRKEHRGTQCLNNLPKITQLLTPLFKLNRLARVRALTLTI